MGPLQKIERLPKVHCTYPLSLSGGRVRVKGGEKLLSLLQNSPLTTIVILSEAKNLVFSEG